jgi:hypothetical protein
MLTTAPRLVLGTSEHAHTFTLRCLVDRASFIGMKYTHATLSSLEQYQSSKFNIVCDTFGTGCIPQLFPNDQGAGILPQGLIAQRT